MNRRELFTLAAALATSQIVTWSPAAGAGTFSFPHLFSQEVALRAFGKKCLLTLPADPGQLLRLAGLHTGMADAERPHAFANKRDADFLSGRIHTIDGWVVAESECALCALIALS